MDGIVAPGAEITLSGAVVADGMSATLDGQPVAARVGAGSATVTVPTLRACDADGRRVWLRVSRPGMRTDSVALAIRIEGAPGIEVGESRVLSASEAECVRVARGAGRYLVSVAHLGRAAVDHDTLGTFDVLGDALASAGALRTVVPAAVAGGLAHPATAVNAGVPSVTTSVGAAAVAAASPDPRLATATVGDVVSLPRMYTVGAPGRAACSADPSTVALREFRVAAVAGRVVMLIGAGEADSAVLLTETGRTMLARAAATIDRVSTAPYARVFGAGIAWYPSAGERVFVALQTLSDGSGGHPYGPDNLPVWRCANSWQVNAVALSIKTPVGFVSTSPDRGAQALARSAIHEFGHMFDLFHPRTTTQGMAVNGSIGGWAAEALAESVVEAAVRVAADVGTAPMPLATAASASGVASPWSAAWLGSASMLGASPFANNSGAYDWGPKLLLVARELDGAVDAAPGRATLYERVLARTQSTGRLWTVDDIAAAVGLTGDALIDRTTLAVLTDNQVPAAVAAARQLPQIATWDAGAFLDALGAPGGPLLLRAGEGRAEPLVAGAGGAFGRYLDTTADRGAAVQVRLRAGAAPVRLRLTRLR